MTAMQRSGQNLQMAVWTEKVQHRFKEQIRERERSGHGVSGGESREG